MREADTREQERSRLQAANTTALPMRQAETAEKIIAAMLEMSCSCSCDAYATTCFLAASSVVNG